MTQVFTNGVFDIVHVAHIRLLEYCKSLGHVTVGLNSDTSVKRLKGDTRPLNTQEDRKEMLLALRWVDDVIIFDEDTPERLICELMPDIIVKGGDYTADQVVGSSICNDVRIFPFVAGRSTTALISRARGR